MLEFQFFQEDFSSCDVEEVGKLIVLMIMFSTVSIIIFSYPVFVLTPGRYEETEFKNLSEALCAFVVFFHVTLSLILVIKSTQSIDCFRNEEQFESVVNPFFAVIWINIIYLSGIGLCMVFGLRYCLVTGA